MWWADIKAAIGQRINVQGLMFSVSVITKNRNWVMPHLSVKDIRSIDWAALKSKGYEGVVFDKDNTLTVPYSLALWGPISESVESCKAVFGSNVAVFSNSAGLLEYDPDGRKARALEFVIGIRVIRHSSSKRIFVQNSRQRLKERPVIIRPPTRLIQLGALFRFEIASEPLKAYLNVEIDELG
ncbi:haloacid dehalogenase superfamily protein [Tanacetum coccineum]